MAKTITIEHKSTTFFLPADELRAVAHSMSNEETRFYLRGVFVDVADGMTKLVATTGHTMLVADLGTTSHVGSDCLTQEGGFILACDFADKAWKAKTRDRLWVYGDVETGILQFVAYDESPVCPRLGVLEFEQIEGTFPTWRHIDAKREAGGGHACAFDPAKLACMTKGGDVLHKGGHVVVWPGAGEGVPMAVEFLHVQHLRGTILPVRRMPND